jgi:hypothetical protein
LLIYGSVFLLLFTYILIGRIHFTRRIKIFTKEDTQIFAYYNGEKVAFCDPIEVQIRLEANNPDFQSNFKVLFDLVQLSKDAEAAKEIVKLGRLMFELPEPVWDEEKKVVVGLTTLGVIRVVMEYITWVGEQKKNIDDMPISLPVTETVADQLPTNVS